MTDQTPTNNTDELDNIIKKFANYCATQGAPFGSMPNDEKHFAKTKRAIHRYTQKMVVAELKALNQNSTGEKCCSTHHALVDRITTIEKEMEQS